MNTVFNRARTGSVISGASEWRSEIDTHDAPAFDALAARVNDLARACARLSEENGELRHQVSVLLASQNPAAEPEPAESVSAVPVAATQAATAAREAGRHIRPAGRRPLDGMVSRRVMGKTIGAAAVGVVGAATLMDLRSHPAHASSDGLAEGDTAAELTSIERAEATATGSVINATLSSSAAVLDGTNSSSGPGVQGSSKKGRGGVFSGAVAQIHLTPGTGSSHPKTGQRGDLYVDKTGRLWYCTHTASRSGWKELG